MKRSTLVLYVACSGMLGAIPITLLIRQIETSDTEKAVRALNTQLGIKVTDVSGVYYKFGAPDFHGNDAHYFRFNYRESDWIDHWIGGLGGEKAGHSPNFASVGRSWWTDLATKDFECFRITSTTYQWQFLWVHRDRKLVLVCLVDT